jgi:peptidoglycan hydrolase-like protein with peptidoglycan-binding domain
MPKAPTSDRISEVQTALSRGGYYNTDPSGKWDADTVDAVQRFQGSNGLDTTGKLDALTLQKLGLGSDVAGVSAPKGITPHSCCAMSPSPSLAPPPAPAPTSLKQSPQGPPPPANALTSSTSSTQP